MNRIIYLDGAATTKVDSKIAKEVLKYYEFEYGNASSPHLLGENARKAIDEVRNKIAKSIGAKPWEIYFTSGATESNNLALQGVSMANRDRKKIIISSIEHPSVYEVCESLKPWGYEIVEIPVDKEGNLDINGLKEKIDDKTLVVSVMHVNNEIGVIQDLEKIGKLCREKGVYFHSDCVQSFGKLKIDVNKMNLDLLSASGHKIGAPKGIGFLYVREGVKIKPIIHGGSQEKGLRSGTENVPGIAGMGKALEVMEKINREKIEKVRDKFILELEKIGGKLNGSLKQRIYNNINVCFEGLNADNLVQYLSQRGIMCSTGSACESKKSKENKVLMSLGLSEMERNGTIRIIVDEKIGMKEIEKTIKEISNYIKLNPIKN